MARQRSEPRRCTVCDKPLQTDELIVVRGEAFGHARCIEGATRPPAVPRPPRPEPASDESS